MPGICPISGCGVGDGCSSWVPPEAKICWVCLVRSSVPRVLGRGRHFASTADGLAGLSVVSGGEGAVAQLTKKLKTISNRQNWFITGFPDPFQKIAFLLAKTRYA